MILWGKVYVISRRSLKEAAKTNPENVFRLAKYLKLNTTGMSARHVAKLVAWRLTRHDYVSEQLDRCR